MWFFNGSNANDVVQIEQALQGLDVNKPIPVNPIRAKGIFESDSHYTQRMEDYVSNYGKAPAWVTDTVEYIKTELKNLFGVTLEGLSSLCLIFSCIGIIGVVLDKDNDLNCKKYVIGSFLLYLVLKSLQIIFIY